MSDRTRCGSNLSHLFRKRFEKSVKQLLQIIKGTLTTCGMCWSKNIFSEKRYYVYPNQMSLGIKKDLFLHTLIFVCCYSP